MFAALCELSSRRRPSHTEIAFAGLVDEECVQAGSRALIASGLKAHLAIVGEPTRLQIVTAHKGVLWLRLETHGKAAHGARPELGRNAVHAMARIVDLLETRYAAELRRRRAHALLGHATVNVGSIEGGRQPNIVPAECFSSIDRRTLPGETDAQVMQEIRKIVERARLRADMRRTQSAPCLPLETNPRLPLVQQFLHHAGQRKPAGVDFFSDAGVLSHGGIPSVVFGPGDIAQAHTPDEWISLKQLDQGKNLLVGFLQSLP
jgi:acetylornithine deacetylase/succinyl-diaminopimelate desuccinylase-like protein